MTPPASIASVPAAPPCFYLVFANSISRETCLGRFFVPTLLRNIAGGLSLVAAPGPCSSGGRQGIAALDARLILDGQRARLVKHPIECPKRNDLSSNSVFLLPCLC